MKTKLLYCFIIIVGSIGTYGQKTNLKIEGVWKLVQSQTVTGNMIVTDFPGKYVIDNTKIWSGNHFMFVTRTKIDTTVKDWYGVGTFELIGNKYEENVRLINYEPWEGTKIKMLLEMKKDTLIQTYPVDDKGEMDKNGATIEKYKRIR